jgi:hypothetical protein
MTRGIKLVVLSVAAATFAPVILLAMYGKKKIAYRLAPALRFVYSHIMHRKDLWTKEVTWYEMLTGEIPRRSSR